ncbi:MAG: zinc ribbon domain-containing protein [Candidatus Parvarchaeota archaeon]|jgi:HSP20 family molecular chaperone IbpA|nr:zinc ribbon domain-containing protein [Candidatus Parvarchaeota archaeon]MCL5018065.1 zinc ribbon domain-containing protein [Candidatus Parvarchaeota archaeon]
MIKKCKFCGENCSKDWNFCPNCGRPLNVTDSAANGISIDMTKIFQKVIPQIFSGMMNGGVFQQEDVQKPQHRQRQEKGMSEISEVIEPEDLVSSHGDTIVHAISLPGIKSKEDIKINKMSNSIEIRALNGKKMYLKILKRDRREGVISEQFANENLVLVLRKI